MIQNQYIEYELYFYWQILVLNEEFMVEVILGLILFVKRYDLFDVGDLYGVNLFDVYFQCLCCMYWCEIFKYSVKQ